MHQSINIKTVARQLKQFVAAHCGEATYGECLEQAAQMLGFENYRAYAAKEESFKASPFSMYQGRVFDTTLCDWAIMQGVPAAEVPAHRQQAYQVVVSHRPGNSSVGIDVLPAGRTPDQCDGSPMLSLNVEVDAGLPCVRLFNTCFGDVLASAYGTGDGLLIEEGNVRWTNAQYLATDEPLAQQVRLLGEDNPARSPNTFIVVESSNDYREN